MTNKTLHLFVGPSASGKTTIANELEKRTRILSNGVSITDKQIRSYTTRPPRYENEDGHIFISKQEFDKLENIVAYTEYNGYHYCATKDQLDEATIYVVDVDGVDTLLSKYTTERPIHIWYFDAHVPRRIDRMVSRGDSDTEIVNRLIQDEQYDWYDRLLTLKFYYTEFRGKYDLQLDKVDADQPLYEVFYTLQTHMEE